MRAVTADVVGFDVEGNRIQSVADYTIFTVLSDQEDGIPPGAVFREEKGEGMVVPSEADRVEVRIAGVFELSGMDTEYDETEEEFRARMDEVQKEAEKAVAIEAARWRVWTTADGKYSVDAKFVKAISGKATLEKRDGTTVVVDLEILCEEDQDFVAHRRWLEAAVPSLDQPAAENSDSANDG